MTNYNHKEIEKKWPASAEASDGQAGKYNHKQIEEKWQSMWEKDGVYKDYSKKDKFYALDMFPYPSGVGLHVGHPKGYIATDVFSRYKMLNGFSVIHPMGWDAFGLPAENYAIQNKVHPREAVEKNIATFKSQLEKFGFTYDWNREVNTTDPEYYKWTQWIFLKMFEKGLAYESNEPVNWCPSCKTVLANEDLENGKCERCGSEVEQKKLRQWVLKMTDYADRLLYDLDSENLDWEEMIKEQQRNWIGRSEGINITYDIDGSDAKITVYTTRPDTNFGATFIVVAPDSEFVKNNFKLFSNEEKINEYIDLSNKKTELERISEGRKKTGEFTGLYAINNLNHRKMPIFVSDFVLANVGTGAVVGVPGHDIRDFEFAREKNLEIIRVVVGKDNDKGPIIKPEQVQEENGIMINSDFLNGLDIHVATEKIKDYIEEKGFGKRKINYKMRDWVFSRQRYWGEPIPVVHCEKCGVVGVDEKDLPIRLPDVQNYEPTGTGEGPLASIEEWVNTTCPKCGGKAKRETNTMPQWAGSSWYYLRYIDPKNSEKLIDKDLEKEWMPVDLYVGGAEHATRHLLYARFWHKFLYDIGAVSTKEPFKKLIHVGLINAEDGRKMSKRWNNVVNPDDIIEQYGADSIRLYEMFMGPFTQNIAWSTDGVKGVRRFLEKVWDYFSSYINIIDKHPHSKFHGERKQALLHKTIKKVSEDIQDFKFNTAISQLMILFNELKTTDLYTFFDNKYEMEAILLILSPFAPHMAEELWSRLGNKESIFKSKWPKYDSKLVVDETVKLVLQVNGKLRDMIEVATDISEEEAKKMARENEKVKKWTEGKEIIKEVFVKNKLVNIVVK